METRARALEQALRELTAMVRGECPSLLNEDSGGNGDLSYQIEKLLAVDPPPSGASPQATGGYIHHSLTDWIPTPECDCDRCTSARKSAPKPTGGASPQADATCEHGTAMDVHCCNCHSGFIFDMNHECPSPELTWREAVEQALGVENDPENHTPSWAFDVVRAAREIGNAPTPASPQADTSEQDVPVLRITVTRDVATEYYAAEFRSADDKVGGMGDYSATPVGALANLCATLIQIDEDNSVERRQPTPVSPVEPEPPTVECCACGHLNTPQQATRLEGEWRSSGEYVCLDSDACSRRIAKCSEPTVEPEPCVWRESGNRLTRAPCFDSPWFGRHAVAAWKVCPYCGAPLKVEKP